MLTGDNTYTGGTTISAGTLQIGNGGTSGSLAQGSVTNNGTLVFNRSGDTLTVAQQHRGNGALTQAGTGTTVLTGTNTYSGGTTHRRRQTPVGNGSAGQPQVTLGGGQLTTTAPHAFMANDLARRRQPAPWPPRPAPTDLDRAGAGWPRRHSATADTGGTIAAGRRTLVRPPPADPRSPEAPCAERRLSDVTSDASSVTVDPRRHAALPTAMARIRRSTARARCGRRPVCKLHDGDFGGTINGGAAL